MSNKICFELQVVSCEVIHVIIEFQFGMECVPGESEGGLFSGREGNYSRRRGWYFFLSAKGKV